MTMPKLYNNTKVNVGPLSNRKVTECNYAFLVSVDTNWSFCDGLPAAIN